MVDFLSPEERSERMSKIRGEDTKPELVLRRLLHGMGLRYRLGGCGLPGRPDLVFPKHGAVVFVHGCFWHHHADCKVAATPKSNTAFWQDKFARNIERDARVVEQLRHMGWRIKVVWECELSVKSRAPITAKQVRDWILCRKYENITNAHSNRK